jgi:hypothetical protein
VGVEHLTDDGAKRAAETQWEATIRYDYGEKYANLGNARGMRWRCDKSSVSDTTVGKAVQTITGGAAAYKRCVIVARPCLVGMEREESEERK